MGERGKEEVNKTIEVRLEGRSLLISNADLKLKVKRVKKSTVKVEG